METMCSSGIILSALPTPSPPRPAASTTSFFHSITTYYFSAPPLKLKHPTKLGFLYPTPSSSLPVKKLSTYCGVMEISESQFSDVVLKSDRPVLVEFVAAWCGPCRLISPAIESLAQEYKEKLLVVKIDHDSNPCLIEEYKVYGLPALFLFKGAREVPEGRRGGAITKAKLKEYVDTLLESVSVS